MKASFKYGYIVFLLPLAFLASSCKQEGCTDKRALNYNSLANKDDGSCLYCDYAHLDMGTQDVNVIDENYYSDYYNQLVAVIHLNQVSNTYNYTTCGQDECKIYFQVENLINKRMSFWYSMSGNGQIFFSTGSKYANISAFQTTEPDSTLASSSFSNFCGTLSSDQIYLYLQNGYIDYY